MLARNQRNTSRPPGRSWSSTRPFFTNPASRANDKQHVGLTSPSPHQRKGTNTTQFARLRGVLCCHSFINLIVNFADQIRDGILIGRVMHDP